MDDDSVERVDTTKRVGVRPFANDADLVAQRERSQQRVRARGWKFILAATLLLGFMACIAGGRQAPRSPYYEVSEELIYAPIDEASTKEMFAHLEAKNKLALFGMAEHGKLLVLKGGTRLVLIKAGLGEHKVRVVDGAHAGQECFVLSDLVKPSIEN